MKRTTPSTMHPRHHLATPAPALLFCLATALAAWAPNDAHAQKKERAGSAATAERAKQRKAERRKARAAKRAAAAEAATTPPPVAAPNPHVFGTPLAPFPRPAPGAAAPAPAVPTPLVPVPARPLTPAAPIPRVPGSPPPAEETKITPFETGIDYQPKSPATLVTFNLEDADLPELVRLISQLTGKRFILPGKTRSIKATVYAPTKVTVAEAYQAFLSILELNGMSIVPAGRYLKLVESGRIEGRPIPLFSEDESAPPGDRFITRIHPVKNISAEDAAALLERFKSGDGSITAYAPTNVLIITDTGTNLQRMLRLLGAIDIERAGEQIWVEPIHHADAADLAQKLSEIFDVSATGTKGTPHAAPQRKQRTPTPASPTTPAPTPGESTVGSAPQESHITKIIADDRTNSLIILATESAYVRILEMLKQLDVSLEGEGRIHVHRLQHTDADEIASTLSALISGRGGAPAGGKAGGGASAAGQESIFEGGVAITAHKGSNALVITSSNHDYAALRHVIDELDSERKQVFIEAVIMELSVDRSSSFGTSFHGGIPDFPTQDSTTVTGFRAANTIGGLGGMAANGEVLSGLAVGVQGPAIPNSTTAVGLSLPAFGVAISALASSGDANILSTPHLTATDNVEAEITVGQNVPLQTSGRLGGLGGLGGLGALSALQGNQGAQGAAGLAALSSLGGGFGGSVPRQDVGTTLKITPHINDTDEIRLEISQEISSAGAPSQSGDLGVVSIDRTKAKTDLVVRDQQTVVIGGLMRDQLTTSDTKVPVLGDIPLLGALFRSSTKQKIKKNLLLFLTPYIVRSPADLRAIYERKMRERQEFLDRYFVFSERDYEAPVDYSRTRGLVGEILLEVRSLDEQRKLIAEAASRPERTHEPRPAVGAAPAHLVGEDTEGEVIEPEGENAAPATPATQNPPESGPTPVELPPPPPPTGTEGP